MSTLTTRTGLFKEAGWIALRTLKALCKVSLVMEDQLKKEELQLIGSSNF